MDQEELALLNEIGFELDVYKNVITSEVDIDNIPHVKKHCVVQSQPLLKGSNRNQVEYIRCIEEGSSSMALQIVNKLNHYSRYSVVRIKLAGMNTAV